LVSFYVETKIEYFFKVKQKYVKKIKNIFVASSELSVIDVNAGKLQKQQKFCIPNFRNKNG